METLPPGSCAQMPQERLWCEFSRPDRKIPTSYPLENHCHCFPWCVPKRHSHFYLFISIIWKAKKQWQKQKKTTTERKKNLSYTHLINCLQRLELWQTKRKSQKFNPALPYGCQEAKHLEPFSLPPNVYLSKKLDSGVEPGFKHTHNCNTVVGHIQAAH